jgi:DNA-directed RNA polymerase subunit RPC12/RpoP
MAIHLKCSECSKHISVDDAFAGGVCRCPYCKATVLVPGEADSSRRGRPAEPVAQRPDVPAAATPAAPSVPAPHTQPVMARKDPTRAIGVMGLILIGAVLVMIGVGAWLLMALKTGQSGQGEAAVAGSGPAAPSGPTVFRNKPSSVAGDIAIQPPVVYVVDGGVSMSDLMEYAALIIRSSVRSLGESGQFSIVVATEQGPSVMPGGWTRADAAGRRKAADTAGEFYASGAADLGKAIAAAAELNPSPATVVVIFGRKNASSAVNAAGAVKAKGAKLVVINLDGGPAGDASGRAMAKAAGGGVFRQVNRDALSAAAGEADVE